MKVVIVGAGSVGFQIAKQLISENKDVVLIEKTPGLQSTPPPIWTVWLSMMRVITQRS